MIIEENSLEDKTNPSNSNPVRIDLSGMKEDDVISGGTSVPQVKEPSLPIIGYNLSLFVLGIMFFCIIFFFIFLFIKPLDATTDFDTSQLNPNDSLYLKKIEVFKLVKDEKNDVRAFFISITQMILLNLLLPVLTAILGYIFGSNNKLKDS